MSGNGVTASLLRRVGITVFNQNQIDELDRIMMKLEAFERQTTADRSVPTDLERKA
jgi:hypothetical protein